MNIDFALVLVIGTLITGVIGAIDLWVYAPKRRQLADELKKQKVADETIAVATKTPMLCDYARSFFPIFLVVLLLRSFLFEPFRIPSGSLKPTLVEGDFILVNKYVYGLKWPVLDTAIAHNQHPKRGDIVVFRWPPNPKVDFIKRVVGLPGDTISYVNKQLTINGNVIAQKDLGFGTDYDQNVAKSVEIKEEQLVKVKHRIYINPRVPSVDYIKNMVVPKGYYFVMGDNRDNSADSRFFGFMPEENLVGKATRIWFSLNMLQWSVRWDRIGQKIV